MTISLATTALGYAKSYGWAVHPVNIEKKPITKHGRNDATRDEQTIKELFRNGAQIGVATGAESGLFVLDVDLDEKRGINGYETLEYLESMHGPLPLTPHQRTGRGGMQYLFNHFEGARNTTSEIGAGIDTRGKGGYIVVAPSRNTNGPYTWVVSPNDAPLADVPAWLIDALKEAEHVQTTNAAPGGEDRPYCLKMLGQAMARCATAPDGQKHDVLLKMATWMGGFVPALSEVEIENTLWTAVALRAEDEQGARKTIRDGIAYGKSKPLSVPELRQSLPPNVNPHTGEISDAPVAQDTHWLKSGVTLADLQHKDFDPETWVVEDILPEGACLLAAKYKSKKSWLALAIGLPIALGGRALGRLPVAQGRVLYLDLEGKQQRIKKRTRAILGVQNRPWPDNFHVYTTWPQGDKGMDQIEQWFRLYPDTRYVVIDVLSDFRRPIERFEQPYQYDRATVTPLNQLFERYHAAGMLVHHFNKAKNDDIMDGISGTTGLPSAVNTMWGLSRDVNNSAITILNLRGRDLERDDPIALKWDSYLNIHVVEGPANEVSISGERRAILSIMNDDEPHTPQQLATELGKSVESIKFLLQKLLNDGLVDKPGYGKYIRVPTHSAYSTHSATYTNSTHSLESELESKRVSGNRDTTYSSTYSSLEHNSQVNSTSEGKSKQSEWDIREGEDTDTFDDDELSQLLGKVGS